MKKIYLILLLLCSSNAMATVLTEDFEGAFPAWESGWLGTNSNLTNVYGVGQDRGNNPDGLWISDGLSNGTSIADITFDSQFGASITDFSFDIVTSSQGAADTVTFYDMSNNFLSSFAITAFGGYYTDPNLNYQTISLSGLSGLSRFTVTGGFVEGNTSVDNFVVQAGNVTVPEPSAIALMGLGLLGFVATRRKIKK